MWTIVELDQKEGVLRWSDDVLWKSFIYICLHDIFLCIVKGGDSGKELRENISNVCSLSLWLAGWEGVRLHLNRVLGPWGQPWGDLLQLRWKTLQVICQFVSLKRRLNLEDWILSSLATLSRIRFGISVLVDIYAFILLESHVRIALRAKSHNISCFRNLDNCTPLTGVQLLSFPLQVFVGNRSASTCESLLTGSVRLSVSWWNGWPAVQRDPEKAEVSVGARPGARV